AQPGECRFPFRPRQSISNILRNIIKHFLLLAVYYLIKFQLIFQTTNSSEQIQTTQIIPQAVKPIVLQSLQIH
ncbi:MAG TPA: hypothetical protein PLW02_13775, partial [Verrucomicrobiota bacterium]|nr:hypothetical protein [Verrucomicrobiota bacterium]